MIKAIIKKELRENLKVALPGMVGFTLLAMYTCHAYEVVLVNAANGYQPNLTAAVMQPLMSTPLLLEAAWLAGILGAVLGWMQISSERNRDLWAFLMHRPVSRTRIFLGKTIAGLALYLSAAGLPLAGFVVWDFTPGHVAAPFEWDMVLPLLCLWLSGIAFYFAGMLTGVRQARWYVSRALGLGLAIIAAFIPFRFLEGGINSAPPLWFWPALILVIAGILGAAAWGSFVTGGRYRGQSAPAKAALIAAVMIGSALAVGLIFALATSLFSRSSRPQFSEGYVINREGTIYRESTQMIVTISGNQGYVSSQKSEFHDLDGNLILSEKTGQPLTPTEFYQKQAEGSTAYVNFGDRGRFRNFQTSRFITLIHTTPGTCWYFWRTTGRAVGYDLRTRLTIGSVGPAGFARDLAGDGQRFGQMPQWAGNSGSWQMFQTPSAAYQVDLDLRSFRTSFTTTPDDPIGGTAAIGRTNIIIVTRKFVHVLTGDGQEMQKTAYQPGYPNFAMVNVWALQPAGRFVVWFEPTAYSPAHRLHTHAIWLAENGAVTNAMDFPDLSPLPPVMPTFAEKVFDKLSNVPAPLPIMILLVFRGPQPGQWLNLILSLGGTVSSIGGGWWLGRRYRLGRGAQVGWGIFHLVFNLMGLLTFVFVQEWPAREKCPNCKKLRVVDHERCEHCGAEFAPAGKNGTEIFEPLGVLDSRTG